MPIHLPPKGATMRASLIYLVFSLMLILFLPSTLQAADGLITDDRVIGELFTLPDLDMPVLITPSEGAVYQLTITAHDQALQFKSIGPDHVIDSRDTNWLLTNACLRQILAPPV